MAQHNGHPLFKNKSNWCRMLPWRCLTITAAAAVTLIVYMTKQRINPVSSLENASLGNVNRVNNLTYSVSTTALLSKNISEYQLRENDNELEPMQQLFHTDLDWNSPSKDAQEKWQQDIQNQELSIKPEYAKAEDVPVVKVNGAECNKMIQGNKKAIDHATSYQIKNKKRPIPDMKYVDFTSSCEVFRRDRQYITKPVSREEAEFPIAFSILLYKDVEQFERLLRAIYRPQNQYCVHVDKKANADVLIAVKSIAGCFENVFIASRQFTVIWGTYSVLEPELTCMADLWKYKKWKYFINLTGQEFPLKTNLDLVKILKTFNGANNMEGTVKRRNKERTAFVYRGFYQTHIRKEPPPVDVTITKGAVHVCVTRGYVDYVLHDRHALAFRDWVRDTGVPDETFFSSLNHSPQLGVPGAYLGVPETDNVKYPFLTRFKNWGTASFDYMCAGKRVRMICVFGVGDLQMLSRRQELFANKFHLDYHPLALDCMEQLHHNRTRNEILGTRDFDATPYGKYEFVQNHV